MFSQAVIFLAALLAIAAAKPEPPVYKVPEPTYGTPVSTYGTPTEEPKYGVKVPVYGEDVAPPKYKYAYHVQDHEKDLDFGHKEERDGYETMGEYWVLLPDGRTMIVTYKANKHGYQPVIKFLEPKATNGY
ncbi:hypothetical protein J437_LFUL006329 [Ladona fulva]|uniref:Cuticle protein n=1 Tax=Ladona fulva TaxID=123851 RepID=A0A8K0K241_LADFU|nr:hypothetical protein J437_LFUL006329 [Ladona fulva]